MTPTKRHDRALKDLDKLAKEVALAAKEPQPFADKLVLCTARKKIDRAINTLRLLAFEIQDTERLLAIKEEQAESWRNRITQSINKDPTP